MGSTINFSQCAHAVEVHNHRLQFQPLPHTHDELTALELNCDALIAGLHDFEKISKLHPEQNMRQENLGTLKRFADEVERERHKLAHDRRVPREMGAKISNIINQIRAISR